VNGTVNALGHGDQGNVWVQGGLYIDDGASVINGNGTIYLRSRGNLLHIYGNRRRLTLDGVTLVGLADNNESLVYVRDGGEFILKSGAITGNTRIDNERDWVSGGGVSVRQAMFTMEGGAIYRNVALGHGSQGGGVYIIGEGSVFTMNGGTISGNIADGGTFNAWGGGVIVVEATFTMSGGSISGNSAIGGRGSSRGSQGDIGSGGGVAVINTTFTMTGGSISSNTAGWGGGIFVGAMEGDNTFVLEGGTIYGNANSIPSGTDARLANNAPTAAAMRITFWGGNLKVRWGTGGTYTRGGMHQTGGSDIVPLRGQHGTTDDTLIAIPAR
jgi:hypothetical protein